MLRQEIENLGDLLVNISDDNLSIATNPYGDRWGPTDAPWQRSGIAEEWRRVMRTDHVDQMMEITLRLNERLYTEGMSTDTFITPVTNGTVRSIARNTAVGGSRTSAHKTMSAMDFSVFYYIANQLDGDSIARYEADGNMLSYLRALKHTLYDMAQEEDLFVRYHNAHFHTVFRQETEAPPVEPSGPALEHNGRPAREFTVPYLRLQVFIDNVCVPGTTSEDVREYNDKPRVYDGNPANRINPGDTILIPTEWLAE